MSRGLSLRVLTRRRAPRAVSTAASVRLMSRAQLLLVLSAVTLSAMGQLLLRAGMVEAGDAAAADGSLLQAAVTSPYVLGGFILFGVSSVLWMAALSKVPLSLAYPFTGLSYLIILAVSSVAVHEQVSPQRWVGACIVLAGLLIVVWSGRTGAEPEIGLLSDVSDDQERAA